ncbi:uncharacterized protein LOC108477903 [Gossypium arboreum]|uniref:uncharacterized protein LOC108477903 n=1 Tax=Gossypium arboreum TaxID=29729 RepID=UPI0022F14FCC|nr:uncharacterized protein LOC108477903 [Gossypium arboreum]
MELRQSILWEAHSSSYVMHPKGNKMYCDLCDLYWWAGLKHEVTKFVSHCLTCQKAKAEHQLPFGLLQPVKIPLWKWERNLAKLYVSEIVRLHRVSVSLISDRDPRFNSHFWQKLHKGLGTRLDFSIAFHSQIDGQSQRMAPYEALYSRKFRTPLCWTELGERKVLGPELVADIENKVHLIQDRLKVTSDRQKSYANLKRREIEYEVGDYVSLKVSHWKNILKFGRKSKLSPRFIGPHQVIKSVGPVVYQLELPPELDRIHNICRSHP